MPWARPLPLESSARCADEVRILMNFVFVFLFFEGVIYRCGFHLVEKYGELFLCGRRS